MLSRRIKQATNNYVENIFSSKVEKKWTFSKVLVIAIVTLTIVITIYACIAMWYFNNIDNNDNNIDSDNIDVIQIV